MSKILPDSKSSQNGFIDVISAIVLAVLLVGIPVTTYLAQHKQDTRKYAKEAEDFGGGKNDVTSDKEAEEKLQKDQVLEAAKQQQDEYAADLQKQQVLQAAQQQQDEYTAGQTTTTSGTETGSGLTLDPGTSFVTDPGTGLVTGGSSSSTTPADSSGLAPGTSFVIDPGTGLVKVSGPGDNSAGIYSDSPNYIQYSTDPSTGKISATLPNNPIQQLFIKDPTTGLSYVDPSNYMQYIKANNYQFFPTGEDVIQLAQGKITPQLVIGGASLVAAPAAIFGSEAILVAASGPISAALAPALTASEIPTALYIAGSQALASAPPAIQTAIALSGPISLAATAYGCSQGNQAACEAEFAIGSQYLGETQVVGSLLTKKISAPTTNGSVAQELYWKEEYYKAVNAVKNEGLTVREDFSPNAWTSYMQPVSGGQGYINMGSWGSYRDKLAALEHEYLHDLQRAATSYAALTQTQVVNEELFNYSHTAGSLYAPPYMIRQGEEMKSIIEQLLARPEINKPQQIETIINLVGGGKQNITSLLTLPIK